MKEGLNKNSKILMLVPSMGSGGAERVMATLANELSERGYDIVIMTLTSGISFYSLKSQVKLIGAGFSINRKNMFTKAWGMLLNGIKAVFFIKKFVKSWEPDLILSFLTHTNILALILNLLNPRIPLIISERAEPRERSFHLKLVTKYFYQTANYLVCQSEVVTDFFTRRAQKKIRIIPNPINIDSVILEEPKKRRKAIIGIGRLFPQKNFSLLINSFNDIKNVFPEHVLEIYGEGYLRDELQNQINNLGLQNRVFLMGRKKNVMKYVYDAQLFVMSSNFEGFPNALIESMASGLPVISTDFSSGIAREIIRDENGLVVPVGNQKEMSSAIRTILSDNSKRKNMGLNNRKIINTLSTNKVVDMWTKLFDDVIR